ncbi:D-alanine-D-alanine ligase [Streptomyces sp. SAI-126]|jgi:D-alanine-D-alanine ligase|uniref:D-alanine--D-alanine ligase family protein n=1 Tax=unclassified Streptomyces TaxID=2593676 RepID=UPI0036E1CA3F
MRVVVLGGGESEERAVSASTACAAEAALCRSGHDVHCLDPARWPETAHFEGAVPSSIPDALETGRLTERLQSNLTSDAFWAEIEKADVVFLALHGGVGESGALKEILEKRNLRITGGTSAALRLAWNKKIALEHMENAGIGIPRSILVNEPQRCPTDRADEIFAELGGRTIVKPVEGGSTLGVSSCSNLDELLAALKSAAGSVLVEERLAGPEFTVGVLGAEPLPPVLIEAPDGWFGYAEKYQPGASRERCPAPVDRSLDTRLREEAVRAAEALGFNASSYSRVDFMLDSDGEPRCLEVNALPGLTENSLLPLAARVHGWSFPELCERIMALSEQP